MRRLEERNSRELKGRGKENKQEEMREAEKGKRRQEEGGDRAGLAAVVLLLLPAMGVGATAGAGPITACIQSKSKVGRWLRKQKQEQTWHPLQKQEQRRNAATLR